MSFFFDLMHAELQGFEDPPGEDSPPPVQSEDSLELSATLEQPCAVMPKEFPELEWDTDLCIPPQADPPILPTKLPDQDSGKKMSPQVTNVLAKISGTKASVEDVHEAERILDKPTRSLAIGVLSQELAQALDLRVCQSSFFFYEEPIWKVLDDDELVRMIRATYRKENLLFNLGRQGISQLLHLLRTSPQLSMKVEDFNQNRQLVNLLDGVLDLETGAMYPAQPEYFFTTFINVSRDDIAHPYPTGAFDKIIANAFGNDSNKRRLLLEIIGTILSPSMPKKFYAFVGESNTGKSKLGEFIKNLVGDQCSLNLENGPQDLREKFTLGEFPGKLLAFCFEMPDIPLDGKTVAKVKQITGDGSLLSGEKKYGAKLQFTNTAKLLFCSNHPLRLARGLSDQAFWNRLVLLPFEHSIPESEQDPYLLEKLDAERGWIVKQAFDAYRDLTARHFEFTQVDIPAQYRPNAQGKSWQAHIEDFVNQACVIAPGNRVRIEDLYVAYMEYCRVNNVSPCDKQHFSAAFGSLVPFPVKRCKMDGGNSRGFEGIALLDDCLALP